MTDNLRERIIEAIAAVAFQQKSWQGTLDCDPLADAVIEELGRGYAIVKLPEPDEGRDEWLGSTVRLDDYKLVLIELCTAHSDGPHFLSPAEAREVADALLAAADKAEDAVEWKTDE